MGYFFQARMVFWAIRWEYAANSWKYGTETQLRIWATALIICVEAMLDVVGSVETVFLCLPWTSGTFINTGMPSEAGICKTTSQWFPTLKLPLSSKQYPITSKTFPTPRKKNLEWWKLEVGDERETHTWKDNPVMMALFIGLWSPFVDGLN